jgi:ABC-2 type transport system permease protein
MRFLLSLFAVVRKELAQVTRDRRVMVTVIIAPMIQLVVFGFAINLDVDQVPTVVCDQDQTKDSRDLVHALFADATFHHTGDVLTPGEASRALDNGSAAVALIIPPGFATRQARRDDPEVQVLIDGTDSSRAQVAANAASQFLMLRGIGYSGPAIGPASGPARMVGASLTPRILFNQTLKTTWNMIPGIAATLLMNFTAIQMAMGLARERELGTIEQILVTPIKPLALLAGKSIPYIFFGLIDTAAVLLLGSFLFEVPIRGSFAVIAAGATLYLFSSLGVGIFLASISKSQQEALLAAFGVIIPASMLSGFMSPLDNMPLWLRTITVINPMRHFLEIMRGCMIKGAGFADVSFQLVSLFLIGTVVLGLAVRRFNQRLA